LGWGLLSEEDKASLLVDLFVEAIVFDLKLTVECIFFTINFSFLIIKCFESLESVLYFFRHGENSL
jgi:hypothetical protein